MDVRAGGIRYLVLLCFIFLTGCTLLQQAQDVTLIREPGQRQYGAPIPVAESAWPFWQYAVLSTYVYSDQPALREQEKRKAVTLQQNIPPTVALPDIEQCLSSPVGSLPLNGWMAWEDFPYDRLKQEADELGLYLQVFEKRDASTWNVAVVFRGTDGSSDWASNLRWLARFIPGYRDQYTLVSESLGEQFVDELAKRMQQEPGDTRTLNIVSTGHSLGGGLAQHFAYSLPIASKNGIKIPRISTVYAFDPSPVTGWYSASRGLRTHNATGLRIDRIFEHGEALAYIRLLQSYVMPPSAKDPAIREIRYNFIRSANVFKNHSMLQMACHLTVGANQNRSPEKAQ